jgi:hypothetical protein
MNNTEEERRIQLFTQGLFILQEQHGIELTAEILPPQVFRAADGTVMLQAQAKVGLNVRPNWNKPPNGVKRNTRKNKEPEAAGIPEVTDE